MFGQAAQINFVFQAHTRTIKRRFEILFFKARKDIKMDEPEKVSAIGIKGLFLTGRRFEGT
jgi:hypothetical protein